MKPPATGQPSSSSRKDAPALVQVRPALAGPTVMAGVRRERISVTKGDLRALSPGASAATCAAAKRLLETVVARRMNERKVVLWGHELQKAYGDEVTATLALAQEPLVEQARSHVTRMMEIMRAMDLMAVCGHDSPGMLGRIRKSMNGKIDTPDELADALDELRLLLDRINAAIDPLLGHADKLRQHASNMTRVEAEVEAAALAAHFLSNYFAHPAPALAQRFTERAMSLTATLAQVQQSDAVRRVQIEQPLQLIGAIQNVALVTLPGFIAGLAALLTLAKTKGASPTEARDVSHQLRGILNQLNT